MDTQVQDKPEVDTSTMGWWQWSQNNSGGVFEYTNELTQRLFIQAKSYRDAENKALEMGVYYNGCERGMDCSCCGDRWYDGDEVKVPIIWDKEKKFVTVEQYAQFWANKYSVIETDHPRARLFYANGDVLEVFKLKDGSK